MRVAEVLEIYFFKICLKLMNFILKLSNSCPWRKGQTWFFVNFHVIAWWFLLIGIVIWNRLERCVSILVFHREINCHIILISNTVFWTWIQNREWFIKHRCSSLSSLLVRFLWTIRATICWCKWGSTRSLLATHATFKNIPPLRIAWNSTLDCVFLIRLRLQIWILWL